MRATQIVFGVAGLVALLARPALGLVVSGRGLTEVYVDVRDAASVKAGDRLQVGDSVPPVGELEVLRVLKGVAVCRIVSARRPLAKGDLVTLADARATAAAAPAPAFAALRPTAPDPTPAAGPAPTPEPSPTSMPAPSPTPTPSPSPKPAPTPEPVATGVSGPAAAPDEREVAAATDADATPATSASPAAPASDAKFRVKYRSAGSVYLEGGRAQGLNVGDGLRVLAGETVLAELEVVYVAEHSASCRVVSEARAVRAGDQAMAIPGRSAALTVATPATAASSVPAPAAAPSAFPAPSPTGPGPNRLASGGAWGRLRGGASLGYFRSWDEKETALDFQQRTGRVDLMLYDIAGRPLSFTLRARSRQDVRARTLSARTPQSERDDRLYEAALRYEPTSGALLVELGRVGIYNFVGVGYLDGAIVRARAAGNLQLGAFGGRTADYESFGFASSGQKYGGFVRLTPSGRYASGPYDVALAFVHESAEGDVSREYLSLESRFAGGSRLTFFERAELDLNRGWRKDLTGSSLQLSNVSLSGNLRLASSANAFVAYDGRRNYRYYQNRQVPEEVFDDLLHQGLRAGVNLFRPGGFGATAGVGMSLKENDPRHPELDIANAYSVNAGVRHASLFGSLSVGLDASGFSNGYTDGGLVSARVGRRFAAGHMVDLSFGRSLYRVKADEQQRTTQWLRLVGRLELGRHLFAVSDLEYDAGDDLQGPRVYFELGSVF